MSRNVKRSRTILVPLIHVRLGMQEKEGESVGMDGGKIKGKWAHNGNAGVSMCECVSVSTKRFVKDLEVWQLHLRRCNWA